MKVDGVLIWKNYLKNFKSPNVASRIYQKDCDIQTSQNVRKILLFIPWELHEDQNNEKFSDYNSPISNDTFELTSINGIPIFVSAEWRDASNGSKSIADWVYETDKPVAPICYFKALSQKAWLR